MSAIQACGLTRFYGRTPGILDLDLSVSEGEVFGFIGPNGAGKTTTIRLILSLIRPTAGTVSIFGRSVPPGGGEVLREVGYLPANPRYYPEMTGRDLLNYAAGFHSNIDRKWIGHLAELLKFDPGRRIRQYSHGNLKKLGIIQALLHKPRLVVLDEPTGGLDPLIRRELLQLLRDLNATGTTIFFSTHVLDEVERLCHRVALVKEGRLIQLSPVDRLPGRNLKLITLCLTNPGEVPELPGWGPASPVDEKPGHYRFATEAPANEVTARLSELDLSYLNITDPSLEDVFLALYEPGKGGGTNDQS